MKSTITHQIGKCILGSVLALGLSASAFAGSILNGVIHMDNGFNAYISTSDSSTGSSIGSGFNWPAAFNISATSLDAGVDYYLHIYGYDVGGIAGFLGEFSLAGTDHVFANGGTTLLTDTTNWLGNAVGFNGTYSSLTTSGTNGVGPWGYQASIDAGASWIWSGDSHANDTSYFTTKIAAVSTPEPASLALFGIALAGLGLRKRKQS